MTVKEYIKDKLTAFKIQESLMADLIINARLDGDAYYDASNQQAVGVAMCHMVEELIFMPKLSSVNENGFSVNWDYSSLGQYYLWLCRKWKVNPDKDTLAALGLSVIIDRTSIW